MLSAPQPSCGTCVLDPNPPYRFPALGEACTVPIADGAGCAAGLACGPGDGGTICEPLRALGAPCEGHSCEVGLQCTFEDAGATCVPLVEVGGPCTPQRRCKGGLFCEQGICVALQSDGASCTDPLQCESYHCSEGTCVKGVVTEVGGRCDNAVCAAELFCRSDGFCAPRVPRGGGCSTDGECELGSECIGNVCRTLALECR